MTCQCGPNRLPLRSHKASCPAEVDEIEVAVPGWWMLPDDDLRSAIDNPVHDPEASDAVLAGTLATILDEIAVAATGHKIDDYWALPKIVSNLRGAGIRHFRDGLRGEAA
jgi:hypothetical protein